MAVVFAMAARAQGVETSSALEREDEKGVGKPHAWYSFDGGGFAFLRAVCPLRLGAPSFFQQKLCLSPICPHFFSLVLGAGRVCVLVCPSSEVEKLLPFAYTYAARARNVCPFFVMFLLLFTIAGGGWGWYIEEMKGG